jgi:drug/metabolite transporter (DMT)-like permease
MLSPTVHWIGQVTFFKCFAVLLSVAGCAVLSLENSQGGTDQPIGYVWEIGSVILYAIYEVFYKKYCCDDKDPFPTANSQRFFGLAGLVTLLVIWPFFFVLDHTGVEKFKLPHLDELYVIIIVAVCDTVFNLFLVITILLTSPLFTSVGTILVIPLGCLVDYLWKRQSGTLYSPRSKSYPVVSVRATVTFCAFCRTHHILHPTIPTLYSTWLQTSSWHQKHTMVLV